MFEKETIIDCKGHLLGRLASIIAKEVLHGQKARKTKQATRLINKHSKTGSQKNTHTKRR